jgi:sarcosine oxidase delta subunit
MHINAKNQNCTSTQFFLHEGRCWWCVEKHIHTFDEYGQTLEQRTKKNEKKNSEDAWAAVMLMRPNQEQIATAQSSSKSSSQSS